ncbi:DUF5709 domain-containing protein [Nocardioides lijunqiniae]|uniref:DUF5709 domain-containing protein n=1 Tax=Nocardioides lijunqiniae TaxID=2760832 RepID=UPI001877E771|nr:DUF5709 domain-containing protein [Nocardioides lijunqiniae]
MSENGDIAAEIGTDPGVDDTGDGSGESYHGYSVDDEDQPQSSGDALVDNRGLAEPMDEGYSPPEKWSAAQGFGNTPLEESLGETLDQRVEQEVPEPDPYEQAELEAADLDRDVTDDTVGEARAGRLVAPDEGAHEDVEKDLVAEDVGIDGAGAGAEEAAVHVIDDVP